MNKRFVLIIVISSFFSVLFDLVIPFFLETDAFSAIKLLFYFTVQTNVIVFVYFLILILGKDKGKFHEMFGGVLIYIFITMSIFIIFLQRIYHPTGFRAAGNIFSHYITPLLVIIYYVKQRENFQFKTEYIKLWIIYPLAYMIVVIIFGSITGDFLYPFFQIDTVGILGIMISIISLVGFFLGLSFLLVKMVSKE